MLTAWETELIFHIHVREETRNRIQTLKGAVSFRFKRTTWTANNERSGGVFISKHFIIIKLHVKHNNNAERFFCLCFVSR
jgi:hypothetical protein